MSAASPAAVGSQPDTLLQYVPFSSAVDTGFWHRFSELKLDVLRLSDEPVNITGFFSSSSAPGLPPLFTVDFEAFNTTSTRHEPGGCQGLLVNKNTAEAFKDCDKASLLREQGERVWQAITDGSALSHPNLLNTFLLLTFADLKRYDFLYWFGFPALRCPGQIATLAPPTQLSTVLSDQQLEKLMSVYDSAVSAGSAGSNPNWASFLVRLQPEIEVLPLTQLKGAPPGDDLLLTFHDPSTDPAHPGWPIRNLLMLYWHYWGAKRPQVSVLCWRDGVRRGRRSVGHSLILKLRLSPEGGSTSAEPPAVTGWEKNERGRAGPRLVNLSTSMDSTVLAGSAVDLNLRLMRWRLVPDLDLTRLTSASCLLLGAGTLGCNVARALMGWGVRHITFVDNATVSYSNPVRQSLYTFQHSVQRRKKAETAAASLRDIFPGVNAQGVELSVPMPGHPVSPALLDQVTSDLRQLEQLVTGHDVIFLLMDSRESRWLPTLLGASHGKIVINAALGYDSYLVMRHGCRQLSQCSADCAAQSADCYRPDQLIPGSQLGCYFCNDVVAPGNSVHDRTLDQQCTVTRPGVSMIAAALAVELAVSLLQHPQRGDAPVSPRPESRDPPSGPLGWVPHSLRGFLGQHQLVTPATRAFSRCTACSDKVVEAYRSEGDVFLMRVFNQPSYLEDLTGLTELQQLTEATEIWTLDDDTDGDDF